MRKNIWMVLALLLIVPSLLLTTGCPPKTEVVSDTDTKTVDPVKDDDLDAQKAAAAEKMRLERERLQREEADRERMAAKNAFSKEDIYFEFDSAALLPGAQELLSKKAGYMLAMSGMRITIEGHCDERGTDAYNMALGERRAEAAKAFLVNLGVSASQINTISYGEERPADSGKSEDAWAKNRRAHFRIN